MSDPVRNVAFCPHCGNTAPQELIHKQVFGVWYNNQNHHQDPDHLNVYFVTICETCQEILVYLFEGNVPPEAEFSRYAGLVWPDSGFLPRFIPERVRECYQEASRIKRLAPNAFAVQIRRNLEAICEDRNAKKGLLHIRLKDLATRGEIPPVLAEMTDVLRLLGNIGAHAAEQSITREHVRVIDEFFRAVIEYVYIAPNKIKEFKETLAHTKNIPLTSDNE